MKDELELRARELLAAEYEERGYPIIAELVRTKGRTPIDLPFAVRAIIKLLESTPLMREALEERARIVGYLEMRADSFVEPTQRDYDMRDAFLDAADEIEAGKHDSISVGGGVVVGEQDQQVTGDGLRPQPATHEPSPSGLGPAGGCQAQE